VLLYPHFQKAVLQARVEAWSEAAASRRPVDEFASCLEHPAPAQLDAL